MGNDELEERLRKLSFRLECAADDARDGDPDTAEMSARIVFEHLKALLEVWNQ